MNSDELTISPSLQRYLPHIAHLDDPVHFQKTLIKAKALLLIAEHRGCYHWEPP